MNMPKNTGKLSRIFAGKGFYITLFLCIAAIGVSCYALFFTGAPAVPEPDFDDSWLLASPSDTLPTARDLIVSIPPTETQPVLNEYDDVPAVKPVLKPQDDLPEATEAPAPTAKKASAQLFVWPANGNVSRAFSIDELQYDKTMGDWRVHKGIDIETAAGAKVYCVADGEVAEIFNDDQMGTTVVVKHDGGYKSVYSNLMGSPVVTVSQKVLAGDELGGVGDTAVAETSEVNHLHFELIKNDESIDPVSVLPK